MSTMLLATIAAHIRQRSELGAGQGMMFRPYLIRADEASHDGPHKQASLRPRLSLTASCHPRGEPRTSPAAVRRRTNLALTTSSARSEYSKTSASAQQPSPPRHR
jgi:hypothetical protein